MNCPECNSDDVTQDDTHAHDLGIVCVCVACDATWISDRAGTIERQTISPGEGRRELQRQIDRDDFHRAFNDNGSWGL